eukprot:576130-Amphidinium_carterae.1
MAQLLRPWIEEVATLAGTPLPAVWRSGENAMDILRAIMSLSSQHGSDVRFDAQTVVDSRAGPWHSVLPSWWVWRVVLAFRLGGKHINCLDQVCLAILVKGRTSSRALNFILRRINATILAGSLLHWTYVGTECNPADKPSRWRSRRVDAPLPNACGA